jgi:hypothetical protein
VKVVLELQTPGWPGTNRKREIMKFRIEIERSALATLVIEADTLDQAETKAFAQVRDEDFGHGNLYLVRADEVTDE